MTTNVSKFTATGGGDMANKLSDYKAGYQGIILFQQEYLQGQLIPQSVIDQIPESDLKNLVEAKHLFRQNSVPKYP